MQVESDVVVRARSYLSNLTAIVENTSNFKSAEGSVQDVISKAKAVVNELAIVIQDTEDPHRLEDLLSINDQLLTLLKRTPQGNKPSLTLQGLGLSVNTSRTNGDGMLDGFPRINGRANGHLSTLEGNSESSSINERDDDEEATPTTPWKEKGKQRADPEPEQSDMILSPKTFMINEQHPDEETPYHTDEEDDADRSDVASPLDRSVLLPDPKFAA